MTASHAALPGLPDPGLCPEAYDGVNGRRALAWLIDMALIGGLSGLLIPFTAFTALLFFPVFMMGIGLLYRWLTIAVTSATPGMWMAGIELREFDGQPLSGGTALMHTLGYTLSVAMAPLQLISVILMVALGRGQGLSDLALGTAALRRNWRRSGR